MGAYNGEMGGGGWIVVFFLSIDFIFKYFHKLYYLFFSNISNIFISYIFFLKCFKYFHKLSIPSGYVFLNYYNPGGWGIGGGGVRDAGEVRAWWWWWCVCVCVGGGGGDHVGHD